MQLADKHVGCSFSSKITRKVFISMSITYPPLSPVSVRLPLFLRPPKLPKWNNNHKFSYRRMACPVQKTATRYRFTSLKNLLKFTNFLSYTTFHYSPVNYYIQCSIDGKRFTDVLLPQDTYV